MFGGTFNKLRFMSRRYFMFVTLDKKKKDSRRNRTDAAPLLINGNCVDRVSFLKLPRAHITEDLF